MVLHLGGFVYSSVCTEFSLGVGRRGENAVNVGTEFCGRGLGVLR